MKCTLCPELVKSRKRICQGRIHSTSQEGFVNPRIFGIAEVPAVNEDNQGVPLVGNSGDELIPQLDRAGLSKYGVYLDNAVKCRTPGDRTPTDNEVQTCCDEHLIPSILVYQPELIITMGRISTQYFLGDVNLEDVHGIPYSVDIMGFRTVIIPSYHPAAGFHNQDIMLQFHSDIRVAGSVMSGRIKPHPPVDKFKDTYDYRIATEEDIIHMMGAPVVAVDTEWAKGTMWCMSISSSPGTALVIKADQTPVLDLVATLVGYGDTTTVIQNALYDLPVLKKAGIVPKKVADTMVMAYLLQSEPQGLKTLAFRHCGMEMRDYNEMVAEATQEKALEYMERVLEFEWPDPEPVLKWDKGEPKAVQPQNITRKVKAALKKGDDLYNRWNKMEGTKEVEEVLGPLSPGELCDIDEGDAVYYSARDADATIRVYPILWERILDLGLEDTFWRDMRALPMVVDMMLNGMPVNLDSFRDLSIYFQSKMDEIQQRMQDSVGNLLDHKYINPASPVQMAELIYDKLKLDEQGGRHKSKKGAKNKSTADDILKRYIDIHPVVNDIIEWRGYQKLKTSYADAIPKMVSEDGRIRTTLRITRVATGRISSSKPNLMAQPTRSEEGRKVRDCYEAGPGNMIVSFDYSQVEMRVTAHDSRDEKMIRIFTSGEDIHKITASEMFGIPISQLDEMKHRYPAKRVGFGILNLITAQGLQRELTVGGAPGFSISDCEDMIKAWFDVYKGVAAYMKSNGLYARRYGYVKDMWGRIRYIPAIKSVNKWNRLEAERQAGNAPIQMGAQGIIKEAMGRLVPVYRDLSKVGFIKPLIQIHDDIVWEIGEDILDEAKSAISKTMVGSTPKGFLVPLEVDPKAGKKWGSMEKF